MGRLYTGGFEENSMTAGVEMDSPVGTGALSISTTTVRSGTYAGRCGPTLTSGAQSYWPLYFLAADGSGDYYLRFYLYIASYPNVKNTIAGYFSSVNNIPLGLQLDTTGVLTMTDDFGTTIATSSALNKNQWYRIEMRNFNTSTTCELLLDGVSQGSSTSAHTNVQEAFVLGGNLAGAGDTCTSMDIFFDDIALNDTSGANQTSYPGSGKVLRLKPNAAGDANTWGLQTGGTAGAANNFTRVNEVTPDDATSYNGSNTLNQEDLYNMDNSGIGASDTVTLVQVRHRGRNITASDSTTKATYELIKTSGGTKQSSTAATMGSTTWRWNKGIPHTPPITAYTDPDGAAWTQTTLDSMQIGMKLTTTGTHEIDITSISAYVDYIPAGGGGGGSTAQMPISYLPILGVG